MKNAINLPEISEAERPLLVDRLLIIISQQQETIVRLEELIEKLKEEIAHLKNHKSRPKISPSKMEEETENRDSDEERSSKDSSEKKKSGSKKKRLTIHKEETIKADGVPEGSIFKGYQEYLVQDLKIEPFNTLYRLEQWQRPDGTYVIAKVPESQRGSHYGPTLRGYILHQYHHQHVTQPLVLEQLWEWDIEISSGQLNRILTEDKEAFHKEKDEILSVGKEVSGHLQTDDTGARHKGKNGYCTYIGNDLFAWFKSTESKSRINFLELLGTDHEGYIVNAGGLEYMERHKLPQGKIALLESHGGSFETKEQWECHLKGLGITGERHKAIATEGALIGSLLAHGFPKDMAILSDDAGQFNVFHHALCWIHGERGVTRLIPMTESQRKGIAWAREQIWDLYADLKAYKAEPTEELKLEISERFDEVCSTKTDFESLNEVLKRLHRNKDELLLVLEKPWVPLHNNVGEQDLRDYVEKRKISGSTRSDPGRQCRDTFASLKKTCRKHGIRFWDYLMDRLRGKNAILPLADYIRRAAECKA